MLLERRRTVGEITAKFRTSRPGISRHLRVLRTAGLVLTERRSAARICSLNAKPLRVVGFWVWDYAPLWGDRGRASDLISRRPTKEKKSMNPTRVSPRSARIRDTSGGIRSKSRSSRPQIED